MSRRKPARARSHGRAVLSGACIVLAALFGCGGAPAAPATRVVPAAIPTPPVAPASIDLAALPAGPFASAQQFCSRWLAVKNQGVAELEARCAGRPDAEGCASDCGYESTCTITGVPAGALGPFRSAQLVDLFVPCGPGDCLLALGTADGVWLADEVAQCSGGEGFSASLTTRTLAAEADALVWRYDHDYGEPPALAHEAATVRCRLVAGRPSCSYDP